MVKGWGRARAKKAFIETSAVVQLRYSESKRLSLCVCKIGKRANTTRAFSHRRDSLENLFIQDERLKERYYFLKAPFLFCLRAKAETYELSVDGNIFYAPFAASRSFRKRD
jgi:hypothetical protein